MKMYDGMIPLDPPYPHLFFHATRSTFQGGQAVVFVEAYDSNSHENVIVAVGHGENHPIAFNKAMKRLGEDFGTKIEAEIRSSLK